MPAMDVLSIKGKLPVDIFHDRQLSNKSFTIVSAKD